jgi:hypothetical protein
MEQIDPTLAETALSLWEEAKLFLKGLFLPWRFYQVAILGGIFAAAHVAPPAMRRLRRVRIVMVRSPDCHAREYAAARPVDKSGIRRARGFVIRA